MFGSFAPYQPSPQETAAPATPIKRREELAARLEYRISDGGVLSHIEMECGEIDLRLKAQPFTGATVRNLIRLIRSEIEDAVHSLRDANEHVKALLTPDPPAGDVTVKDGVQTD